MRHARRHAAPATAPLPLATPGSAQPALRPCRDRRLRHPAGTQRVTRAVPGQAAAPVRQSLRRWKDVQEPLSCRTGLLGHPGQELNRVCKHTSSTYTNDCRPQLWVSPSAAAAPQPAQQAQACCLQHLRCACRRRECPYFWNKGGSLAVGALPGRGGIGIHQCSSSTSSNPQPASPALSSGCSVRSTKGSAAGWRPAAGSARSRSSRRRGGR